MFHDISGQHRQHNRTGYDDDRQRVDNDCTVNIAYYYFFLYELLI